MALVCLRPDWDPAKASRKLDERAAMWQTHERTRRSHDTTCISCHSGAPYLVARPSLRELTGRERGRPRREGAPRGRRGARDPMERGRALVLPHRSEGAGVEGDGGGSERFRSFVSRAGERKRRSDKRALENLWTVQRDDGGFDWLHFDLAPWETDESDLFGSCLAAVAVSIGLLRRGRRTSRSNVSPPIFAEALPRA